MVLVAIRIHNILTSIAIDYFWCSYRIINTAMAALLDHIVKYKLHIIGKRLEVGVLIWNHYNEYMGLKRLSCKYLGEN